MSDTQSIPANRSLAAGLRELADWLDAHPELPLLHANVRHTAVGDRARNILATVAAALGERAIESYSPLLREVTIRGEFTDGRIIVSAAANPRYLGAVEPVPAPRPDYEPIIPQAGR